LNHPAEFDITEFSKVRTWAAALTILGAVGVLIALYMVFFYSPTESEMGPMQRIYYIHVPTAWVGDMAFGLLALCSLGYLLLREDRMDAIALSAAEVGIVFWTATLIAGPLWAKLAWGAWWVWDARLSFSLLLWLIWIGYFILRQGTDNPERGKRLAAVLALVGAVDIPVIHMSVYWFRTQHPQPVLLKPEPTADFAIGMTMMASVFAFTFVFFGLLLYRYGYERLRRHADFLRYSQVRRETAGSGSRAMS
jgi:heme exporter protein C